MFARVFAVTVLSTVAAIGETIAKPCSNGHAGRVTLPDVTIGRDAPPLGQAWRPKERWMGVNLPYCLYHKEVRKDATYKEEDFQFVHELGLNFVRLPLDYRCWIKDGDWNQIDEAALAPLDQAVDGGKR